MSRLVVDPQARLRLAATLILSFLAILALLRNANAAVTEAADPTVSSERPELHLRSRSRQLRRKVEERKRLLSSTTSTSSTTARGEQQRGMQTSAFVHPTLAAAFDHISPNVVWPALKSYREDVSSTFGPRILEPSSCPASGTSSPTSTTACYDFHPGVTIDGHVIGDPVVAVLDGTVVQITDYECRGLTVDVRHTFANPVTFRPGSDPVTKFYTRHQHLNRANVTVGQTVDAGQVIAEVGDDGQCTTVPQLHFELILGTTADSAIPTESDARVHPYHVLPHLTWTPLLEQISPITTSSSAGSTDGIIKIDTRNVQPNVDKYYVQILSQDGSTVRASHTVDLNLKTGLTTTAASTTTAVADVYVPDVTVPHLLPATFSPLTALHSMELVIPASWVPAPAAAGDPPDVYKVVAVDVRGHRYEIEGSLAS